MTLLILWRHGNTDWNAGDRVQGQLDPPLNDLGRRQAAAAAQRLAALRPAAIVSSDLRRAADTAAALAALTDLPVRLDPRLRERHFGQWQGLTIAEIAQRYPAEYARWRAGEPEFGCGAESVDDMAKRVGAALREAVDAAAGGTVVVTTHGGSARHGIGEMVGWPPQVTRSLGGLGNCHWSELRLDAARGWRLRAHNLSV
ncbi:MAG: histidine phosphatase family protein [Micromonosporaceae bacterium]|jgi:probable phosphoglycerate mutase|nr:histidine phosphatase family protein [Micromonosporaceae bacterium]